MRCSLLRAEVTRAPSSPRARPSSGRPAVGSSVCQAAARPGRPRGRTPAQSTPVYLPPSICSGRAVEADAAALWERGYLAPPPSAGPRRPRGRVGVVDVVVGVQKTRPQELQRTYTRGPPRARLEQAASPKNRERRCVGPAWRRVAARGGTVSWPPPGLARIAKAPPRPPQGPRHHGKNKMTKEKQRAGHWIRGGGGSVGAGAVLACDCKQAGPAQRWAPGSPGWRPHRTSHSRRVQHRPGPSLCCTCCTCWAARAGNGTSRCQNAEPPRPTTKDAAWAGGATEIKSTRRFSR